MKISGFTMVRNADQFYFPIKESIASILPLVDEFVVALGDCHPDDKTRELIESLNSPKVKIIDRVWSEDKFVDGLLFAEETTFALENCSGDWCFYLQADEVVHEEDLPKIKAACEQYLEDKNVDGFLFKYRHFWGDYEHYLPFHGWYKNEIRVVRNNAGIYSYKDAQSFRKNDDEKLNVKLLDAYIYHYGWVRPPEKMIKKKKEQDSIHHGRTKGEALNASIDYFDYGKMNKVPVFKGTHPKVMDELRGRLSWQDKLNFNGAELSRPKVKHERTKYRLLSWLENTFFGGKELFGGYSNWNKV